MQARADRLHNDLDELKKALNMKYKKIGLPVKPISLLELPFGKWCLWAKALLLAIRFLFGVFMKAW